MNTKYHVHLQDMCIMYIGKENDMIIKNEKNL